MVAPPVLDASVLDESAIRPLVERFYGRVRADAGLAAVFGPAVADWDDHHARLTDFWSSVMLGTGRFKGNPMAMHLLHADALSPALFQRWLGLWRQTTDEMLPPPAAAALQEKAARFADVFQTALNARRPAPLTV
jgi:hemoglobin